MISDTFEFVNEVHELVINNGDILVSCDVSSLFTNVPLEETKQLLADKAFINNWFNETYHLNLNKLDLVDLLRAATKEQLFISRFTASYMNRPTELLWASPLVLC